MQIVEGGEGAAPCEESEELEEWSQLHGEIQVWLESVRALRRDEMYKWYSSAWVPQDSAVRVIGVGCAWSTGKRRQTARLAMALAVAADQGREETLTQVFPEMQPLCCVVSDLLDSSAA